MVEPKLIKIFLCLSKFINPDFGGNGYLDCRYSRMVEPASLAAPPIIPPQTEESTGAKKGMTLAGVGESAIGTAGVMLLKDQLFDKDHRVKFQQQMNHLLQQQAFISRQLQEMKEKLDQLSKMEEASSRAEKLLM